MDAVQQPHGDPDHRDVEDPDDSEDGGVAGDGLVGTAERTQHQVARVDGPQDDRHREPRIPGPPHAPDRPRPDRAGDEHQGAEQHAHLGRGVREAVGCTRASPEIHCARTGDDEEAEERRPGRGNVEVEDALHDPHLRLGGHYDEDEPLGHEHEYQDGPREQRDQQWHQSRITCSKSRTPATTKIASNATSTPSAPASAPNPPRSTASVAFTPPISTGTSSGSRRTGSITSRARARTVMAANSVAREAKPRLPRKSTSSSAGSTVPSCAWSRTPTSGTTSACITASRTTLVTSFPRYSVAGSMGDASTPPRQSFSRSRTKPRWMPSRPVNTNAAHSTLGARRGASAGAGSRATLKITTSSTPSTTKPARLSFVRHSMRRSFRRMARTPRHITRAPSRPPRRTPRGRPRRRHPGGSRRCARDAGSPPGSRPRRRAPRRAC